MLIFSINHHHYQDLSSPVQTFGVQSKLEFSGTFYNLIKIQALLGYLNMSQVLY